MKQSSISFILDGNQVELHFPNEQNYRPTTTVLNYLRSLLTHKGVQEGCAEGDCGACTIVLGELENEKIQYKAVDSCLVFLPMLHGKQLITVENLATGEGFEQLHPVQKSMVETSGSQCGFCTPGIIMSLFSLYKNHQKPNKGVIQDYLTGNLCRCTGYKPIIEAAAQSCVHQGMDQFNEAEPKIKALLKEIPQKSLAIEMESQKYYQPTTLSEALLLKKERPTAVLINGATDIALRVTKQHELLTEIIDLSMVKELKAIQETKETLTIGTGVDLNQVLSLSEQDFPALHQMLSVFGSRQIRSLATLGGNLGTASPIGDTPPVLLAYNAKITLASEERGERTLSLDEFFLGYRKTALAEDELIVSVILPKEDSTQVQVKSYKISKRKDLDISTLSGGFRLELNKEDEIQKIKLVYGGMAAITKRATTTEEFLVGKKWTREIIEQAMPLMDTDFQPISDVRGSEAMRRIAAKNLLLKFWSETQSNSHPTQVQ